MTPLPAHCFGAAGIRSNPATSVLEWRDRLTVGDEIGSVAGTQKTNRGGFLSQQNGRARASDFWSRWAVGAVRAVRLLPQCVSQCRTDSRLRALTRTQGDLQAVAQGMKCLRRGDRAARRLRPDRVRQHASVVKRSWG